MSAIRKNEFGALADHLTGRIAAATQASAADLIAWVVTDMSAAKSGMHWPGAPTTSSAPGESPAVQFGALAASLHEYPLHNATDRAVAAGGPTAPYAVELEEGSPARKLAPRPYLGPAAHAIAPAHWRGLARALVGKGAR